MISSSLWWMLLLAAVSCVHCVELTQPASSVVSPGEALTLSCKVSGYSLTDSSYCTHWIRQAAGKPLEWIGRICSSGGTDYSNNLKSRFQITRDTSSSTVTLQGQNMRTEDTSVYYCARESLCYKPQALLFKNISNDVHKMQGHFPFQEVAVRNNNYIEDICHG